jgi:preprotein translocase subunit YajC
VQLNQLYPYIILWVLLLAAFFYFIIRPKRVAVAQHKEFLAGLKRGDKIVTAGGLHGDIVGLQEDTVTLHIAPGVDITLDRRAVRRRQRGSSA